MPISIDSWSTIAIILIFAALIFWAFRITQNRLHDIRRQEEMAEFEFENSLLNAVREIPEPEHSQTISQPQAPSFPAQTPEQVTTPLFASNGQELDLMKHPVIIKLQHAGLVRNVEFYRELHGRDKGAVAIRLRNGQTALFVPHWESEAFLRRYEKQVDLVIMATADGQNAVVVTPLSRLIADSISL